MRYNREYIKALVHGYSEYLCVRAHTRVRPNLLMRQFVWGVQWRLANSF